MLMAGGMIAVASLFPLVICFAITVLEMAVSAIQAYVFVLLTVIYLKTQCTYINATIMNRNLSWSIFLTFSYFISFPFLYGK